MKKYIKELIIFVLQMIMFYVFPLTCGPTDTMGMVVLLLFSALVLSLLMGAMSKEKIKYLYPILVSLAFIPSIFIYYNSSALIHSVWYLVISIVGLLIGMLIGKIKTIILK